MKRAEKNCCHEIGAYSGPCKIKQNLRLHRIFWPNDSFTSNEDRDTNLFPNVFQRAIYSFKVWRITLYVWTSFLFFFFFARKLLPPQWDLNEGAKYQSCAISLRGIRLTQATPSLRLVFTLQFSLGAASTGDPPNSPNERVPQRYFQPIATSSGCNNTSAFSVLFAPAEVSTSMGEQKPGWGWLLGKCGLAWGRQP